jgi:hypothetical protein
MELVLMATLAVFAASNAVITLLWAIPAFRRYRVSTS